MFELLLLKLQIFEFRKHILLALLKLGHLLLGSVDFSLSLYYFPLLFLDLLFDLFLAHVLLAFSQFLLMNALNLLELDLLVTGSLLKILDFVIDLGETAMFVLDDKLVITEFKSIFLLILLVYLLAQILEAVKIILVLFQMLKLRQYICLKN
jgi:hypothetical protein